MSTSVQNILGALQKGGVPVISPDGIPGTVPAENAAEAISKGGFKRAVVATDPSGKVGLLPVETAAQAIKGGYSIGLPTQKQDDLGIAQPEKPSPGIWDYLGAASVIPRAIGTVTQALPGAVGHAIGPQRGAEEVKKLIQQQASEVQPEQTTTPRLAGAYKKVIAPAAEASADILKGQYEPENIATLGAFRYVPGGTALLRTLKTGAGAYFAIPTAHQAIPEGVQGIQDIAEGRTEEGVKNLTSSAFHTGMAADVIGDMVRGRGQAAADLADSAKQVGSAIVQSKPGQFVRNTWDPSKSSPEQAATMAFRPRNSKYNWKQEIQSALPDMRRASDTLGKDPEKMTLQGAHEAVVLAKRQVWDEYAQNFSDPIAAVQVDVSPVAQVIRGTITQRMQEQNPGLAKRINRIADTYEGRQLPAQEIEARITELNNKTAAIEAKHPANKRAAQNSPDNAYIFAERNALRNVQISKMDEMQGPGAQALRNRYGALSSVEDVIQRRIPVAERQRPESMPKVLTKAYAAGKVARGLITFNPADIVEGGVSLASQARSSRLNDPNYLTQQAFKNTKPAPPFQRTQPPTPIPNVQPPEPQGGVPNSVIPNVASDVALQEVYTALRNVGAEPLPNVKGLPGAVYFNDPVTHSQGAVMEGSTPEQIADHIQARRDQFQIGRVPIPKVSEPSAEDPMEQARRQVGSLEPPVSPIGENAIPVENRASTQIAKAEQETPFPFKIALLPRLPRPNKTGWRKESPEGQPQKKKSAKSQYRMSPNLRS